MIIPCHCICSAILRLSAIKCSCAGHFFQQRFHTKQRYGNAALANVVRHGIQGFFVIGSGFKGADPVKEVQIPLRLCVGVKKSLYFSSFLCYNEIRSRKGTRAFAVRLIPDGFCRQKEKIITHPNTNVWGMFFIKPPLVQRAVFHDAIVNKIKLCRKYLLFQNVVP